MKPPETSDLTTGGHEHLNQEEVEKMDFMKVIDALKQHIKNALTEMDEKYNRKFEELNKSVNDTLENQGKTIKQIMETVQDLKTEMEAKKKTQTEGRLDMENLSKQTESTDTSITNRIQELEERISDSEDTIEKINTLIKENSKSNKLSSQNIQELWDTIKRPNLRIIGVEEGEEVQLNGPENIFNKIIEENFPNLKKDIPMKVQEAYRTPNRLYQKKNIPSPYNYQNTKHTE